MEVCLLLFSRRADIIGMLGILVYISISVSRAAYHVGGWGIGLVDILIVRVDSDRGCVK